MSARERGLRGVAELIETHLFFVRLRKVDPEHCDLIFSPKPKEMPCGFLSSLSASLLPVWHLVLSLADSFCLSFPECHWESPAGGDHGRSCVWSPVQLEPPVRQRESWN